MKTTTKLILNVAHHDWMTKKILHSRSSKMTLNSVSFTFSSYQKTADLDLTL